MVPAEVCEVSGESLTSSVFVSLFLILIVADLCVNSRALWVILNKPINT